MEKQTTFEHTRSHPLTLRMEKLLTKVKYVKTKTPNPCVVTEAMQRAAVAIDGGAASSAVGRSTWCSACNRAVRKKRREMLTCCISVLISPVATRGCTCLSSESFQAAKCRSYTRYSSRWCVRLPLCCKVLTAQHQVVRTVTTVLKCLRYRSRWYVLLPLCCKVLTVQQQVVSTVTTVL